MSPFAEVDSLCLRGVDLDLPGDCPISYPVQGGLESLVDGLSRDGGAV